MFLKFFFNEKFAKNKQVNCGLQQARYLHKTYYVDA